MNGITIIAILIFTIFSYSLHKFKKNKKNTDDLLLDLKYKDIEISLLGVSDIKPLPKQKSPFYLQHDKNDINLPIELIINGKILMDNLNIIKKDYYWLKQTINKKGTKNIEDVNCAILDKSGILHIKNN